MAKAPTPAPQKLPAELVGEIASAGGGRDITKLWAGELESFADKRIAGDPHWQVYARIAEDDQVFSTFQQRRRAVVSRDWDVLPGDEEDPKSVAAAEALKDNIAAIGWDRITDKMLWATFNGYSVAELMWAALPTGFIGWSEIRVRKARRFRFGGDRTLRLITSAARQGEVMPDRKFWTVVTGASDDDEAYGVGLGYWLYWPALFKRNGVRFWNVFLDKFGTPTAIGKYPRGTPSADQDKLLGALAALATDSGLVVPDGVVIELLQKAASGTADFKDLVGYMDAAIAKIVLSQTMTTDNGSSRSQAEVHAGVKLEVVKADADLLSDSFNAGPARWFTDLNFGTEVASPRVVRVVEEEADTKVEAETDEIIMRTGWKRTKESFTDTYGDGFEPVPEPRTPPAGVRPGQPGNDNVVDLDTERQKRVVALAAAEPRPLYVYRRLVNAADLIAWAGSQGFASTLPAQDLHVTIAYSKQPLNWFDVPEPWSGNANGEIVIQAGGARAVDQLGDEGAVVLHFVGRELVNRWREIRDAGASWDYPSYLPHVSITYQQGDLDLSQIEPFRGELRFGPEIFEPIEDGWHEQRQEIALAEAAPQRDEVDEAVDAMIAEDGFRVATAMTGELLAQLHAAPDEAAARAILAEALGLMDEGPLTEALERAGFAKRLGAETGA